MLGAYIGRLTGGFKVNTWTQEQDNFLRSNWKTMSDEYKAASVGHPISSTKARRCKLGLYESKVTMHIASLGMVTRFSRRSGPKNNPSPI